jgi:hypothetical protein
MCPQRFMFVLPWALQMPSCAVARKRVADCIATPCRTRCRTSELPHLSRVVAFDDRVMRGTIAVAGVMLRQVIAAT